MLVIGLTQREFPFLAVWKPKPGATPRVVSFATNEREFNNATREHVEYLDARIDQQNND